MYETSDMFVKCEEALSCMRLVMGLLSVNRPFLYETCDRIARCEQVFSCMRLVTGLLCVNRPAAV